MRNLLPFVLLLFSLHVAAQSEIIWDNPIDIASNTYSNQYAHIVLNASGNPIVTWGRTSDQSLFFSRWDGTQFTAPAKLNDSLTIASAYWMGPEIASHGDTIYVVMKQTPETDTSSHIFIVRSFDGGITFSNPNRVDYIGDSLSRFTTVTTDASGNPIVAFMKFNSNFTDHRWVVTKSTDYGNTFSADTKASGWGGSAEVCDCCPGTVVSEGNNCAVLYRNNNSNLRDIWAGISNNNAGSFTSGFNVDNNNWQHLSCPASGPDAVIIGDTIYSVFMNGASGKNTNYFSKANVNDSAVSSVNTLIGPIAGLAYQSFPRIANDGYAAAIAWKQVINSVNHLSILYTDDIRNGFTTAFDTVDTDYITNEDVAIANDRVFVIWQDNNSGTVKFRSGTITPIVIGIEENESAFSNITAFPNPSSDIWNINGNSSFEKTTAILYNSIGEIIATPFVEQTTDLISMRISNLQYPSGLYFIKLNNLSGSSIIRLIKE